MKMVLSLIDLSLTALRDCLENGKYPDIHFLPPLLRQQLLSLVLKHGTINKPACLELLSSVNFLDGLSSLDIQKCTCDNIEYLRRICQTLAYVMPNGSTIGSQIANLSLDTLLYRGWHYMLVPSISLVASIIGQCPNLRCLNWRLVDIWIDPVPADKIHEDALLLDTRGEDDDFDHRARQCWKKEAMQACWRVISNLREMNLKCSRLLHLFLTAYESIEFKNLSSIRLTSFDLNRRTKQWLKFMSDVRETLVNLNLHLQLALLPCISISRQILPFSIPNLETLVIENYSMHCSGEFVNRLVQSSKLKFVRLELGGREVNEAGLHALAKINAKLDIKLIRICVPASEYYDVIACFAKIINILNDRITHFRLDIMNPEDRMPQLMNVIGLLINACPNLVAFHIDGDVEALTSNTRSMQRLFQPLFMNLDRAMNIRLLNLHGDYDHSILEWIFRNCLHLETLIVQECQQLDDAHLIEWASRGARPSKICFYRCHSVSDDGLIAVLKNTGKRLHSFSIHECPKPSELTWHALAQHCPYVKAVDSTDMTDDTKTFLQTTFLNKMAIIRDWGICRYKFDRK